MKKFISHTSENIQFVQHYFENKFYNDDFISFIDMSFGEGHISKISWEKTEMFHKLQQLLRAKVKLAELRNAVISACNNKNLHLSLTREEKSRKGEKLIEWYEKNWNIIETFLNEDQEMNDQNYAVSFNYFDQQNDYFNQ